jgi:hypothetical protein
MALFNISVLSTLDIPREVRDVLRQIADGEQRVAVALEAIVVKMNEADVPPSDAVAQGVIDALVAKLHGTNVELAAEVQRVSAELFPPAVPPAA